MTIELSIQDVRRELVRALGVEDATSSGKPATMLLGRWFHGVFADLVCTDPARSGVRVIVESGDEDGAAAGRALLRHVYDLSVGPRLSRHQAQVNETSDEVLTFWRAVQRLCGWLIEVVQSLRRGAPDRPGWLEIARRFAAEEFLACELREPGWSDGVRLIGIADALLRTPDGKRFCALELKLGRGRPPVDLGQVALYHLIATRRHGGDGALALLRFSTELEETVITAAQVADAQAKLIALVGNMAGVDRPAAAAAPSRALPPTGDLPQRIVRAYREYGTPVELPSPPLVGPRFLRFEVRLGKGVTVAQVEKRTAEVGIRAGLAVEPMVRRIAGQLCIDVPRPDPQVVPFAAVRDAIRGPASARLPIGVDPAGTLHFADLSEATTAHVLVAGGSGSGKSEWLRTAIAGLMLANTPDTLRMAFIDPKVSAFKELRRSRWLLDPSAFWVPREGVEIVDFLERLVDEMERRYQRFAQAGVDDLAGYRDRGAGTMPRLVCFCDEYFALISTDRRERKEIERQISILAAKGRAAGVHLVIATQQASREVIKGALDANLPCRVGLRMAKDIESKMLLGTSGAERLTGHGDLLFKALDEPVRLQAPYLAPDERKALFSS